MNALPYIPTPAEARVHLRRWTEGRAELAAAVPDAEIPGAWIPVAVEVVLEEIERLEALNAGMVVTVPEEVAEC
jgi:hypothetical protein